MFLSELLTRNGSLHELWKHNWVGSLSRDSWASCLHQHIWARLLGLLPQAVGCEPTEEPLVGSAQARAASRLPFVSMDLQYGPCGLDLTWLGGALRPAVLAPTVA